MKCFDSRAFGTLIERVLLLKNSHWLQDEYGMKTDDLIPACIDVEWFINSLDD